MASRLELQSKLEELLGTRNVYYQPPESIKMRYTAIRYSKSSYYIAHANNSIYSKLTRYEVVVIAQSPDDPVIDKILELPYCAFGQHYVAENLYHDVFTLYY
jgi:hypothetical protein